MLDKEEESRAENPSADAENARDLYFFENVCPVLSNGERVIEMSNSLVNTRWAIDAFAGTDAQPQEAALEDAEGCRVRRYGISGTAEDQTGSRMTLVKETSLLKAQLCDEVEALSGCQP